MTLELGFVYHHALISCLNRRGPEQNLYCRRVKKHATTCCTDSGAKNDDRLLAMLARSADLHVEKMNRQDMKKEAQEALDNIQEEGEQTLNRLCENTKAELAALEDGSIPDIDSLIAEEVQSIIDKLEEYQRPILSNIQRDKILIRQNMEKIKRLSEQSLVPKFSGFRALSFILCLLLVISAGWYTLEGFEHMSIGDFGKAATDVAFAALVAYMAYFRMNSR